MYQNLTAIAYAADEIFRLDDEGVYIGISALDRDGAHPKLLDRCYFRQGCSDTRTDQTLVGSLGCWGGNIALRCSLLINDTGTTTCKALRCPQLWDWQHSTVSNVSLDQRLEIDTRFRASSLTQTRGPTTTTRIFFPSEMLIVNDRLKFYSIEDMAQVPQLLACLMFPVSVKNIICLLPMDMIFHIAYDDRRCKPNVDLTSTTIPCHVPLSSSSFPPGFSSI